MSEVFISKVQLMFGTQDLPGWSVLTRVSKNPSHVGACYACEQPGSSIHGGQKPQYGGDHV